MQYKYKKDIIESKACVRYFLFFSSNDIPSKTMKMLFIYI